MQWWQCCRPDSSTSEYHSRFWSCPRCWEYANARSPWYPATLQSGWYYWLTSGSLVINGSTKTGQNPWIILSFSLRAHTVSLMRKSEPAYVNLVVTLNWLALWFQEYIHLYYLRSREIDSLTRNRQGWLTKDPIPGSQFVCVVNKDVHGISSGLGVIWIASSLVHHRCTYLEISVSVHSISGSQFLQETLALKQLDYLLELGKQRDVRCNWKLWQHPLPTSKSWT